MIVLKDAETLRYIRMNRAGELMTGYTRFELLGKTCYDILPPEQAEQFMAQDRAVIEGQRAVECLEEPLLTRKGVRIVQTKKVPVFDYTGRPLYLLSICGDLTQRKALEDERLQRARAEARAQETQRVADRLQTLVHAGEALGSSLQLETILNAFTRNMAETYAEYAEVALVSPREDAPSESFCAHRTRTDLEASLRLSSTKTGEEFLLKRLVPSGRAEVITADDDYWLKNVGASEDQLAAWRTADLRSVMVAPLRSHGQDLGFLLLARPSSGAHFDALDLTTAQELAARVALSVTNARLFQKVDAALRAKATCETRSEPTNSRRRVLVVDDAADNRMLIQHYVARMGYCADIAGSGEEAVTKVHSDEYDVVLMDVQMPGMDGFEALAHLRADGFHKPIVALTAHTMKGDRERCLENGFDGFLGKPVNRNELQRLLDQCVSRT